MRRISTIIAAILFAGLIGVYSFQIATLPKNYADAHPTVRAAHEEREKETQSSFLNPELWYCRDLFSGTYILWYPADSKHLSYDRYSRDGTLIEAGVETDRVLASTRDGYAGHEASLGETLKEYLGLIGCDSIKSVLTDMVDDYRNVQF